MRTLVAALFAMICGSAALADDIACVSTTKLASKPPKRARVP